MTDGIRFIEGFEGDSLSLVWEKMGPTRHADHARTAGFGIGRSGTGLSLAESPICVPTTSYILGFAFRWKTGTGSGGQIIHIRGPGDHTHVTLGLDGQRALYVEAPDGSGNFAVRGTSGEITLDEDTWYYIELMATASTSAGSIIVQLNGPAGTPGSTGAEVVNVSGIRTLHPNASVGVLQFYNQFHMGSLSGFLTDEFHYSFDDIYVRDNLVGGFLGDQEVHLIDLEDDRVVQFTRLSGTKNYLMVNEVTPDEDTSHNETDTDQDEDVFEIGDQTFTGTIHCVQLVARAKKTETQVWTLETELDLSGTKAYGTPRYLAYPDYETLPPDVYGDAPGQTGWTNAQLNAVGVGYRAQTP